MKNRIYVQLKQEEADWLKRMAAVDVRAPKDMIRYLLTKEAEERGIIEKGERGEWHCEPQTA